jgi:site-specific recombinase XerD
MFESLFTSQLAVHRHRTAPLRKEREQFLEDLHRQGASRATLWQSAGRLVYIVEFLNLRDLRPVTFQEIKDAAKVWLKNREPKRVHTVSRCAIYGFTGLARRFIKFHGYLSEPAKPPQPFSDRLSKFLIFLTDQKGLRPDTVRSYRWHTEEFLKWFATRHKKFSAVSLTDLDAYLLWQSKKWTAWTLRQAANTLRSFFQYARTKNWCPAVLPEAIKGPCFSMDHAAPVGPSWDEVQRLLRCEKQDTPASMRVQVLLLLFSLYGLRTSEATRLLLNNFDWKSKTFLVRRAKNYTLQRFPMFATFESAVTRYLKLGRPNCQSQYLIVTLRPPYRPLDTGSVAGIINSRMTRLGIRSPRKGPQSLRHACATQLLKKDMSLQEIADFLGHRDCLTVGIYAKHDVGALKRVAALDLCRGL